MSEENENKPNLDVPEHLEYSDEHVWVDASTEPAMVGITEYAADQLGELVYIDLPEVGTEVQAGDEVAELESSKAVTPLVTPVAGGNPPVENGSGRLPTIRASLPAIRMAKAGFLKSSLRMTNRDCFPPKNTPTSWRNKRLGKTSRNI